MKNDRVCSSVVRALKEMVGTRKIGDNRTGEIKLNDEYRIN